MTQEFKALGEKCRWQLNVSPTEFIETPKIQNFFSICHLFELKFAKLVLEKNAFFYFDYKDFFSPIA